jgi:hypothetical protein
LDNGSTTARTQVPGLVQLAIFLVAMSILVTLIRRKNWLRWLTVFFFVFHLALTPWALAMFHDTYEVALYWVECLSGVLAAVLLCTPIARQWFTFLSVT